MHHDEHNEEEEEEDGEHHHREEKKEKDAVCLGRLWPSENESISKEEAEKLLFNLTLSLRSHFRFHCHKEEDGGGEEGSNAEPTPEFFVNDLLQSVGGDAHDGHEDTFDENVVKKILQKLRNGEKGRDDKDRDDDNYRNIM